MISTPLHTNAHARRKLVVLAAAYFVINLIGLTRSPLLWVDEATLNDAAREYVATGHVRSSVFADVPAFAHGFYWQPPLQSIVSAGTYSVFGFGVWQTRIPPLLFASASLFIIGIILYRFTSSRTTVILTVLLFGCDPVFSFLARSGRMDSMCIFFMLLSMWFVLRALETCEEKWSMAAGLFLGAAGISHPIAAGIGVGIVLGSLLFNRPRLTHTFALVACSSALPMLWFAYAWFSGEWDSFRDQFLRHGSDHLASSSLWQRLLEEGARYVRDYNRALVVLPLYMAAVALAVRKAFLTKERTIKMVLIWFATSFVFNVVFMTKGVGFYGMYPVTVAVVTLGIAAEFFEVTATRRRVLYTAMSTVVILTFSVGTGGRLVKSILQWNDRNPDNLRQTLEARVPRGSRVYGDGSLWYAAHDLGYKLSIDDYFLGRAFPNRRYERLLNSDYVVLEKKLFHTANLSALSLVDSIVVTSPSIGQGLDTLYALYILQPKSTTERDSVKRN
ncbi:MAG: hypothetical protein RL156_1314 [Bacteroidota bacterium]